jgi:hypothetical protein
VGWVVVSEKGGEPFLATVATDDRGYARNFWRLGTLAAEHQMEVRAIVDGGPTVLDTIHATARPGPAVTAWLVGDSVQAILPGQSLRILLEGRDQYGNTIAPGDVKAVWTSSVQGVATVSNDGTATGIQPGRTLLTAQAGNSTLRVHLTVNSTRQKVIPISWYTFRLHDGGGRFLAVGHHLSDEPSRVSFYRKEGDSWVLEPGFVNESRSVVSFRVLPSGEAWAASWEMNDHAVWRSSRAGDWTRVPRPSYVGQDDPWLTSVGDEVFYLGLRRREDVTRRATVPIVHRWNGNGWTELPYNPSVGDSAFQVGGIAATGVDNIYIGGLIQRQYADGAGAPFIARWDGSQWNRLSLPPDAPTDRGSYISHLTASESTGTVIAMLSSGTSAISLARWCLLEVSGNIVSVVPNPLTSAGAQIVGISVAPDGALYLAGLDRVVWRRNDTWREHVLMEGWKATTVYVDTTGRVWVGAVRSRIGEQIEYAVIEIE